MSHHRHTHALNKDQRRAYAQMCANELAATGTSKPVTPSPTGIRPAVLPSLKFGDTIVMRDGRTYRGRPPQFQFISEDGGLTGHWVKTHKGLPYVRVLDRALQK